MTTSLHGFRPDIQYGCKCDVCPLGPHGIMRDPTKPWAPVPAEIHQNATVIAIAENPADEEVSEGRPLVGKSGTEGWNPALVAIGKKRSDVDLDNVTACQCPGEASGAWTRMETSLRRENERRALENLPALPHPKDCCAPRLKSVISRYQHVIALGGTATKELTGLTKGILSVRGGGVEVEVKEPSPRTIKVMPTLHPAFVNRKPQWREVFTADLAKAFRWFRGDKNWTEPWYEWRPSPTRLREWLRYPARFTVHDYETTLEGALRAKVYCLGFGRLLEPPQVWPCEKCSGTGKRLQVFNQSDGWSPAPIEQRHLACECCQGRGERLVETHSVLVPFMSCEDRRRFYTESEEQEIRQIIAEHMTDYSAWKVGHNICGFDRFVTEREFKAWMWPYVDTLPMARARNPSLPKGLKIIGSLLTDVHRWGESAEGEKIATEPKSDKQLHYYCGNDVAVNAKVYDPLYKLAEEKGYFRPLREELKPKGWPAHYPWTLQGVDAYRQTMANHHQRVGLWVNQERRERWDRDLKSEAWKYKAKAMKYAHELGITGKATINKKGEETRVALFNPGSDDQIRKVLEARGVTLTKVSEKTGKFSVDDEVLREVITSDGIPEDFKQFIDSVRRFKRAAKSRSTFVLPLARRDLWVPELTRTGKQKGKPPLCWPDGRVRPNVSEMITSVARLNSSEINEHNYPVRLRDQICAQPIYAPDHPRYPGRVLISCDVDQFHLRIIANRWKIARLQESFHQKKDPHSGLAVDFFGDKFKNADGWGPEGFSLLRKPKKDSPADKMRHLAKVLRYRFAYADTEEGLLQTVRKVEDQETGDMPFAHMTLREVKKLYRIAMRAEPEWFHAWQWVMDQYKANGGWIEECVLGRRSGDLEGGKKQAVVNYDILAAEPAIMTLIEADVRAAFPDDFEGPGTGMIVQVHDSLTIECEGFAWTEIRNGKKVVVGDEQTEKRRQMLQDIVTRHIPIPGWDVPITAEAGIGPVRDEFGNVKLSNWKES